MLLRWQRYTVWQDDIEIIVKHLSVFNQKASTRLRSTLRLTYAAIL